MLRLMLAVAATLVLLLVSSAPAHADPDPDPDLVCSAFEYGQTPDQIADSLRRNDARLPRPQLPSQIFRDLEDCQ